MFNRICSSCRLLTNNNTAILLYKQTTFNSILLNNNTLLSSSIHRQQRNVSDKTRSPIEDTTQQPSQSKPSSAHKTRTESSFKSNEKRDDVPIRNTVDSSQGNEAEYGIGDSQNIGATEHNVKSGSKGAAKNNTSDTQTHSSNTQGTTDSDTKEDPVAKRFQQTAKQNQKVRSKQPHPILSRKPPTGSVSYDY